jgi:hypothetical protein
MGWRWARFPQSILTMDDNERNLRIAQAVHGEFAWNDLKFHEGEFVAVLDGQIVAVKNNADDAIAVLRALDPDPQHGMVVEVARPAVDVIRRVR